MMEFRDYLDFVFISEKVICSYLVALHISNEKTHCRCISRGISSRIVAFPLRIRQLRTETFSALAAIDSRIYHLVAGPPREGRGQIAPRLQGA